MTERGGLTEKREQAPALQKRLLVDGGEGFVGGAEEGSGFIENNGHGDVGEKGFEFPFVLEGVKENTLFHFFENFDGDAAGNVNPAERQNFQGEISCFRAVDGSPEIQSVGADAAGLVQTEARNLRSGIGAGVFERRVYYIRREKFVKGAEAPAGENEFATNLGIAAAHEAQELDLLLGVRREIRMPAFGRHNAVTAAVPRED